MSRYTITSYCLLYVLMGNSSDKAQEQLHDNYKNEFDKWMVGSKDGIVRVPLDCLGPWHQIHWDGHEKISSQALNMGGVGLPVYAGKDQFSSFVPIMWVVPNVRLGDTIGHLFLDIVEDYRCTFWCFHFVSLNIKSTYLIGIPLQITTDKGSKILEMIRMHEKLRFVLSGITAIVKLIWS